MKKSIVVIIILAILLVTVSGLYISEKSKIEWIQKDMDTLFASSYNNLTLNLLNSKEDGISEDAIHMYQTKMTKEAITLTTCYNYTSFAENGNKYLNSIVHLLAQSCGYGAVTDIDMDLELYHIIKEVPNDYFNNEEILKKAKEALSDALID